MEIKSNTYYVLFCKKDYSRTLVKGAALLDYQKVCNKPMLDILWNFDVQLAKEAEILLYAKKEWLNGID